MVRTIVVVGAAAVLLGPVSAARAGDVFKITLEGFQGLDQSPLNPFFAGIEFDSTKGGPDWTARDGSTGFYNVSSWPSGQILGGQGEYWIDDLVFATGGLEFADDGIIRFDNADATYVELRYCSANEFFLEAYDVDGELIDSDSGPANLRFANENPLGPGTLRVDWDLKRPIASVKVHDAGNQWLVDNIATDATRILFDCNRNGIPEAGECDGKKGEDCNDNGIPDDQDIAKGTSQDCNGNGIPDECDIADGTSQDCNGNGIPDECDIADGTSQDCNGNGIPDECDIAGGGSTDLNFNGVPDECEGETNFGEPAQFAADGEPLVEATGDLDGDGDPDVVAVTPGSDPGVEGFIQVFLNLGNGPKGEWLGLQALTPVMVGRDPSGVALGLLDADAHLDVAVTNRGDDTVYVLFNAGQGDGTLHPPVSYATGDQPSSVIAADLTEDGPVDLGITNQGDANVLILVNDGNGVFSPGSATILVPAGIQPLALTSDDFDNDKCLDMGGVNGPGGPLDGAGNSVFVLLGLGGGNYEPAVFYEVGNNPSDIASGDLNGDGFSDITASNADDATVSVLINQGDGTFVKAFDAPVGDEPKSVDMADVNDDGKLDLAVAGIDAEIGAAVQVLTNTTSVGAGSAGMVSFGAPLAFSVAANPNFVANADFNGDGLPDLVTVNDGLGSVSVLISAPDPISLAVPGDAFPEACPNLYNPRSQGYVPVALVGGGMLDVLEVDIPTLRIERVAGLGGSVAPNEGPPGPHTKPGDVAAPFAGAPCDCDVSGPDGVDDLDMKFSRPLVTKALLLEGLADGSTIQVKVTALLLDGTPIKAIDCFEIEPSDLDGNGTVDVRDLLVLLKSWGTCDDVEDCVADLDLDGQVGITDLLILLVDMGG
jgi:hypothetical protein